MSRTISITTIARNFSEFINRVAYRRESYILLRGKKPVAELRPTPQGRTLGELPKLLASLPRLLPEDAEEFAKDLNAIRTELAKEKPRDPWDSY